MQKDSEIFVSPGTSSDFRDMVKNGSYQLPLYPTSLLLATDIELTVDVPFIFHTLPTLIQLSYDRHISGGFGPFSFGPLHRASAGDMKFRVGVRDNKIAITLPGTQLIGYVSDVVPQHPIPATADRSRRSTDEDLSSSNTGSEFNEWLFTKRKSTSFPGSPYHNDPEKSIFPLDQAEHLIAPTHSSNSPATGHDMDISTQYNFGANNSLGYATKT